MRERGSPPWAFALAQVRIRSAGGHSQSVRIMMAATSGRKGSHDTGVPSRGPAQELKQHLCSCNGIGRVGSCGQEPKSWRMRTKESLTVLEARLTHKSAQQTQPRTGWARRCKLWRVRENEWMARTRDWRSIDRQARVKPESYCVSTVEDWIGIRFATPGPGVYWCLLWPW